MKQELKTKLSDWENATSELAYAFINHYFGKDEDQDWYWVADNIGDVLFVNDRFFNVSDLVDFIKYNYSKSQMFGYYDYRLELYEKNSKKDSNPIICIRDWKRLISAKLPKNFGQGKKRETEKLIKKSGFKNLSKLI